jgi:hypothetical protein
MKNAFTVIYNKLGLYFTNFSNDVEFKLAKLLQLIGTINL